MSDKKLHMHDAKTNPQAEMVIEGVVRKVDETIATELKTSAACPLCAMAATSIFLLAQCVRHTNMIDEHGTVDEDRFADFMRRVTQSVLDTNLDFSAQERRPQRGIGLH